MYFMFWYKVSRNLPVYNVNYLITLRCLCHQFYSERHLSNEQKLKQVIIFMVLLSTTSKRFFPVFHIFSHFQKRATRNPFKSFCNAWTSLHYAILSIFQRDNRMSRGEKKSYSITSICPRREAMIFFRIQRIMAQGKCSLFSLRSLRISLSHFPRKKIIIISAVVEYSHALIATIFSGAHKETFCF